MSLEAAIHERWSSDGPLTALVPIERLLTGAAFGQPTWPYVVLHRVGDKPGPRTSSQRLICETLVRFDIWARDFDQATSIAAAVSARFERAAFPLISGAVLNMQRAGERAELTADDVWRYAVEYHALTETSYGD